MDRYVENGLREDSNLLQRLFAQLGGGLAVHDPKGKLLRADAQIQIWYGAEDRLIGQHCCDIYRHRGVEECPVQACIDRQETVESTIFTASFSGDARLLKMIVIPSLTTTGTLDHLLVCLLDMSRSLQADHRRSLAARRQRLGEVDAQFSERKYEAISANVRDAIIMIDHRGLVAYWNASATRIFGYTLEEVKHKDISDLIIPEAHREAHRAGFQNFLKAGSGKVVNQTIVVNAVCSDGSLIRAELSIAPVLMDGRFNALASIRDVTAREERKHEAEKKERMFNALFNSSQPVFILDRQGQVQSVNSAFYSFSGYTDDELIGIDFRTLSTLQPDMGQINRQIIRTGCWTGEVLIKRSRDQAPVILTVNRIAASNRQAVHYIGQLQDLSETRRKERELIQLQNNQELDYLSGGMAHDFRNMLAVIQGNLSLLERQIDPPALKSKKLVADMEATIQAATDLTENLFELARTTVDDPQHLDLTILIGEFVLNLSGLSGPDIRIRVESARQPVYINVVKNELRNAMLNLALNAIQAMPDGGELSIGWRQLAGDNPELQRFGLPGNLDYAVLTFTDTGSGIDSDLQPYIFEPLYTSGGSGRTGLGLTMVRRFVHNCGGHVHLDSKPGSGSRFSLLFPATANTRSSSSATVTSAFERLGADWLALVVDDESQVRNLVLRQLKNLGFATLEAETIESAMTIVSETPFIDLIITDILMPGELNGVDLALWMQQTRPQIPLLLMSGYFNSKPMREHPELTSLPRLDKPFTQLALAGRLRSILGQETP